MLGCSVFRVFGVWVYGVLGFGVEASGDIDGFRFRGLGV